MGVGSGVLLSVLVEVSWSMKVLSWERAAIDEIEDECEED